MSDGTARRRSKSGSSRARQRRKGAQRGGQRRPAPPVAVAEIEDLSGVAEAMALGARRSTRRAQTVAAPRAARLSRAAEYAYIESDLRRLLIIAGGLLLLMLVVLVVVGR